MSKVKLTPVVETTISGVATVNQKNEDSINASPIEYVPTYSYYVPRQKFHQLPVSYDGQTYQSKRVFAVEMKRVGDKWEPTGNLTAIKLTNMRQTYFGKFEEGKSAPVIGTHINDKGELKMNTADCEFINAVTGAKALGCQNQNPFIKYDVMMHFDGKIDGYTPKFVENKLATGEDETLLLEHGGINTFHSEPMSIPGYSLSDIIDTTKAPNKDLVL